MLVGKRGRSQASLVPMASSTGGSVIIHHFAIKSSFFMLLGACRLKKRILVLVVGLGAVSTLMSCGGYTSSYKLPPSRLTKRVLASQGVSASFSVGSLVIVNALNDTLPRVSPLPAGNTPGLMALSPTRNIAATFDSSTNTVYAVNTAQESSLGRVQLSGPTTSMVVPAAQPIGYAAVPTATING